MNNTEENIDSIQDPTKEEIDRKEAEQLLDEASESGIKPADRKKKINSSLKILIGLYKAKEYDLTSASFISIARAYYIASITILPKGVTIPEKKKEALRKGIKFIDSAIEKLNGSSPDSQRAFRIKSMLSIEYNRIAWEEFDDKSLKRLLKESVDKGCTDFNTYEGDIQIAIRLCELGENMTGYKESIIESINASVLQKAKAYYFIETKDDKVKEHMDKCISFLKDTSCSHPLWEETVNFIKLLKDKDFPLWKNFVIETYESCRVQEREMDVFHLRWYWSRHRALYDMAFLAVKEQADEEQDEEAKQTKIKKLAEISDSLKGLFSLRLSDLEKMAKSDDELKKYLDAYVTTHQDAFVKRFSDVVKGAKETTGKASSQHEHSPQTKHLDLENIPKGKVVVHFYLNQLEQNGYAIVYNKDTETWQYKPFKDNSYKELFSDFLTWQTNYNLYKEDAAEHLVTLCKKIGETMPFLFHEDFIPNGRDVLFIPHDFLHRLPLHGAIKKDTQEEVFLRNHACCYLPAWSFASKKDASTSDEYTLLKNFNQGYFKELQKNEIWGKQSVIDGASSDDLRNIKTNPKLLTILCHGEADMTNPFRSRLKLANGGITILETLISVNGLKGSQIILGACETDLVPPLSDVMDEHFSIATALLLIGAAGIVGTMWEVKTRMTQTLINCLLDKLKDNADMKTGLNEWQKDKVTGYKDYSPVFYRAIAFRSIGFPL